MINLLLQKQICSFHDAYISWHSLVSDLSNVMFEELHDSEKPLAVVALPVHTSLSRIQVNLSAPSVSLS